MATALRATRAECGSELGNAGQGWGLSLAARGKGQDDMQGGGGLEGSTSGRVTPSRDEGAPGPGSRLTGSISRSLQLPLHTGWCIRRKVPLAGRRGHQGRWGFFPHLHSPKSNLDPNCTAAGHPAQAVPTWYRLGLRPSERLQALHISRELLLPSILQSRCGPPATGSPDSVPLIARKKNNKTKRD